MCCCAVFIRTVQNLADRSSPVNFFFTFFLKSALLSCFQGDKTAKSLPAHVRNRSKETGNSPKRQKRPMWWGFSRWKVVFSIEVHSSTCPGQIPWGSFSPPAIYIYRQSAYRRLNKIPEPMSGESIFLTSMAWRQDCRGKTLNSKFSQSLAE